MSATEHLHDWFEPEHYELFLHPDKEQMDFTGSVTIRGRQIKPSHTLKLHAKGLRITSASFSIGSDQHDFRETTHGDQDVLHLQAATKLEGELSLTLDFRGEITEPMVGLYPCTFEHEGETKRIIATQFESHHAREVFPCIDEPAAKATFDLTLRTLAGDAVVANTEAAGQTAKGQWLETTFATTPKMSTYLLAFVTGELESRERTHGNGVVSRIWTTPLLAEHTDFALNVAVRVLDFYNEYFGLDYPLTKCDHVALPDFAAGAMENWGLITYRESLLAVDDTTTSLENKQAIALVIAHELAHQWFGNLVTMQWWTDLWLNEGFASWIEYLAVDTLFPDWRIWDQFVSDEYMPGLALDSLQASHPVEVTIDDPEDIRSIFDAISYNKGASVIRMLHNYLGPSSFQVGLRQYLVRHAYGNASTKDLWQALEDTADKPVRNFMSAWTTQAGYPVVTADIDVAGGSVKLSQAMYRLHAVEPDKAKQRWPIPVSLALSDEELLLDNETARMQVINIAQTKLNRSQTGWYITRYDREHISRLVKLIADRSLEPLDRLGPIHDTFRLAKAGMQPTSEAFELLAAYANEDNVVVWDVLLSQLVSVKSAFDDDVFLEHYRPFTAGLLVKQYQRLGWEEQPSDSHFDKLLRPLILAQASANKMPAAIKEALRRFERADTPQDIAPDIRGLVCATAVREHGAEPYNKLLDWYRQTQSAQIKSQLTAGLCSARQPALIDDNLEFLTSGEVKLQQVAQWVSYLFSNHKAKNAAWDWMKHHWDWLLARFGTDIMTISYFPKIIGNAFSDETMIKEYDEFFNRVNTTGLTQPVVQGRESLMWRSAWRRRDYDALLNFLKRSTRE